MDALMFFLKIMLWICFAAVIFFLGIIVKLKFFPRKQDEKGASTFKKLPKPAIKMLNREGDPYEDEWHTYIAGLPHHASKYDIGGFCGYVANDSANVHDPLAMGVYNSFKLLGYIPAKELKDYGGWSGGDPMPCVGFIFAEDGQIRGRVKILKPCNEEFLGKEFGRYLQWIKDNYGEAYLPKSLSIKFDAE